MSSVPSLAALFMFHLNKGWPGTKCGYTIVPKNKPFCNFVIYHLDRGHSKVWIRKGIRYALITNIFFLRMIPSPYPRFYRYGWLIDSYSMSIFLRMIDSYSMFIFLRVIDDSFDSFLLHVHFSMDDWFLLHVLYGHFLPTSPTRISQVLFPVLRILFPVLYGLFCLQVLPEQVKYFSQSSTTIFCLQVLPEQVKYVSLSSTAIFLRTSPTRIIKYFSLSYTIIFAYNSYQNYQVLFPVLQVLFPVLLAPIIFK